MAAPTMLKKITRPLPNGVTYDLTEPSRVVITLPEWSTWSSGLHWHETHREYLKLVKGSIKVRLGASTRIVSVPGTEIEIPRGAWHEWQRADAQSGVVIVEERTDPDDGEKRLFFFNLNGIILSASNIQGTGWLPKWVSGQLTDLWITLGLFVIFGALDNYPVFLGLEDWVSWFFPRVLVRFPVFERLVTMLETLTSHFLLGVAGLIGHVAGVDAVQKTFTPPEEYQRWQVGTRRRKSL
jgi:hypothetical protein